MPRIAILLSFLLFLPALVAADDEANQLTEGEKRAGWSLLFDGENHEGWRGFKKESFPEKGWEIEAGWLRVIEGGGGGDIITKGQYQNFEFSLEWKAAKNANSGIMYLASEAESTPWMTAPEFQIFDDEDAHSTVNTSAGGLYALYSPVGKTLKPTGEVNHARIVVMNGRVEHYLNGVKVVDCTIGSDDWKERVAASKFSSMPKFGTVSKGHISLQDHGNDVWFRNIKVREIPEDEAKFGLRDRVDLFNGRDFTGLTHFLKKEGAKLEDTWRIEDGILICSGDPAGYIRTVADYTNYELVVEWRWSPVTKKTGNSGVLLRMVGEDKVWPRCIEAQLMAGHAGDFYNIGEFPMMTHPTRTKGRHTAHSRANENAPGEWNRYDIKVHRGHVELKVNGAILNNATKCWETPGKICLQSEGAEIHFRTFRLYRMAYSKNAE